MARLNIKIPKTAKSPKGNASRERKVFILEDHPLYLEGLVKLISSELDFKVCGTAKNAAEALLTVPRLMPDLILVDIGLEGKSGLWFIKEVHAVKQDIKLLVISMHDEALYADRVLKAGGDGYIMKQEDPEEIVHAMRDVLSGHIYLSEEVLANAKMVSGGASPRAKKKPLDQLTDSELELLELLGKHKSNQQIARLLSLSVQTITAQCLLIRKKLKIKSAKELIRYAVCWVETGVS